ncbi:hypothetical protein D3C71_1907650 [compost metagenome]
MSLDNTPQGRKQFPWSAFFLFSRDPEVRCDIGRRLEVVGDVGIADFRLGGSSRGPSSMLSGREPNGYAC